MIKFHIGGTLQTVSPTSFVVCTMYQGKVDVDMQNAVKSVLADVSSVSPSTVHGMLLSRFG